jgi:two-component system, OmpR family, sensor histidine kinase ChvG
VIAGRIRRRWARVWSPLGARLLAFNLLVVFLPVAGVLYLDVYETQLLVSQERGMVQQARLVAASLGDREEPQADELRALLTRLGGRGDARIRLYDARGTLLADSAQIPLAIEGRADNDYRSPEDTRVRMRVLYRLGAWIVDVRRWFSTLGSEDEGAASKLAETIAEGAGPEVTAALQGRYGANTRESPGQRSLTLHSAVPIRHGSRIVGAVVVSQSTYRILQALYAVRLRVFEIVIASLAAATVLSVVLSLTIVRPLVRLRRATAALGPPIASPVRFPGVDRHDEIGELARALDDLARRLEAHIALLEGFAADVAHEFRNPLASVRTAAEMLVDAPQPADRQRFFRMLSADIDRLDRLVGGVRELASIDAQLAHQPVAVTDLAVVVRTLLEGKRMTLRKDVRLVEPSSGVELPVRGAAERLVQVVENLIDNAISFAPAGSAVIVEVGTDGVHVRLRVRDAGPGIPPEHLDRIFDRFFTYRPDASDPRTHAGLGLAIAAAIVRGYGGSIHAANNPDRGACFEITLPSVARSP